MTGKNVLPEEVEYKGLIIHPIPEKLAESGNWTLKVEIQKRRGSGVTARPYSARNNFATREEAVRHCFEEGRQIIDGEIPNLSVNDL